MAIKDFALRVSLTVCKPQLTAKDDKATSDAETANNAAGAGQYRKDLYPKHLIAPISEVESQARGYLTKRTLNGILPTSRFMDFANQMSQFEVAFNQAVTVFLNNYTNVLTEAQHTQGGLYDPGLYPDLSSLRSRFSWQITYEPIADTSSFATLLAPMEDAAQQQITQAVVKQIEQQQSALVGDAVTRLQSTIKVFAEAMSRPNRTVLSKKTGGVEVRPPIIRTAVRDNIEDCVALLNDYMDALPPDLGPLMAKASALTTSTITQLQEDDAARDVAKQQATSLLKEIAVMMGEELPTTPPVPQPVPQPEPQPEPQPVICQIKEEPSTVILPTAATADLFAAIADLEND